MENEEINKDYPNLSKVLSFSKYGLSFKNPNSFDNSCSSEINQGLKYYYHTKFTDDIIKHNIRWARGKELKPKFQFIYLMLPTRCNQKCFGCFMGHDNAVLPGNLNGDFYSENELDSLLKFAVAHDAKAIVYGGGGELFTWKHAISYIKKIYNHGLRFVVFTNGTLLDYEKLKILNDLETSIIISLRDTNEKGHNQFVKRNYFKTVLRTINDAIELGFHKDDRLSIEIPGTINNENRIIDDLLPALRYLNIIPMIEEFINDDGFINGCSNIAHSFSDSKSFFKKLQKKDKELGFNWKPELGTRILGQPKCQRSLFSFTVFPNRDITDCPAGFKLFGNINKSDIYEVIYSDYYKNSILNFDFCACSVFYSNHAEEIPNELVNKFSCHQK